ncbi:MAG: acyltransferase [Lachnospiraceae bacterium]|nr:acyltransferase [Lachnospiraceae bacterium]
MDTAKRSAKLDIIKAVAIIFVVIRHFGWGHENRLMLLFPYWINTAVPVFMIISGYVYSLSYQRKQVSSLNDAYRFDLWVEKIIRFTVPFFLIYLLEIPMVLFIHQKSFVRWMSHFFAGGYGPGSYYFPVMIQFVFVFPFIYYLIKKFDFTGVFICGLINFFYEILQYVFQMSEYEYRLLIFRYILLIACGCYFAIGKRVIKKWVGICALITGALWIYETQFLDRIPYFSDEDWTDTNMIAALWTIPIMWILLKSPRLDKLHNRLLEAMGRASYDIFLVQMVYYGYMGDTINRYIGKWLILGAAFNLVLCTALGLLFYRIEDPITKKVIAFVRGKDHFRPSVQKRRNRFDALFTDEK